MYINKSNKLIQHASFNLDQLELKILSLIISLIDSKNDKLQVYYSFDIRKIEGLSLHNNYEQIKQATRNLSNKGFEIIKDNGEKQLYTRWVSSVTTEKDSGIIQVEIPQEMREYYLSLNKNYTSYQAIHVFKLRSKYSIRLYELLHSHKRQKKVRYSLIKLKKILDISDKYADYRNFKIRVLNKAMNELKEKSTDIYFTFERIGRGDSKDIVFTIITKKPKKETILLSGVELELEKMGFNQKERKKITDLYDDDRLKRNIKHALENDQQGKIKTHIKAFLRTSLKFDWEATDYSKTTKDSLEEITELETQLEEINKKAEMQDDFMDYLAKATERNKKGRAAKLVGLIQEFGTDLAFSFKDNPNLYNLGILVEQFFKVKK